MARVVVAGAGPGGAAAAHLLARRGVEVTLLERQTDFAREFRGEGLMPSGLDAFEQMGLGAALEALPSARPRAIDFYREGRHALHVDVEAAIGGARGPRFVSQPHMLEMLAAESARLASFRIERGVTVRDVVRNSDGRIEGVRVDGPDGTRELRADFTIGADGRASVLRRRAGLDADRPRERFDVVWCKTPLPKELEARPAARFYLGRGHLAIVFPAPDGRLQVAWVIEKGAFGELRRRGIDAWLDELAKVVSPDLAGHLRAHRDHISSPFLLDVVCDHLLHWSAPGLLLIGDAAHPMSPVGAQGINIALRDAIVVSNRLGPALARDAGPGELDAAALRVRDERLPEVQAIQALQRRLPRLLFLRGPAGRVFATVLPLLLRTGIAPLLAASTLSRFANGATEVRLDPV